jgi:hypothetical protein
MRSAALRLAMRERSAVFSRWSCVERAEYFP